jgi:hypothetical protein
MKCVPFSRFGDVGRLVDAADMELSDDASESQLEKMGLLVFALWFASTAGCSNVHLFRISFALRSFDTHVDLQRVVPGWVLREVGLEGASKL